MGGGGVNWKKSPPETVLDVHLCLSGGKSESYPGVGGEGRGGEVSSGFDQVTTRIKVSLRLHG